MRLVSYGYLVVGVLACLALFMQRGSAVADGTDRSMAWVLALPWSMLSAIVPGGELALLLLMFAIGILVNFAILHWIADHSV